MDPLRVSLVAFPEAAISTLTGVFDVMNAFAIMSRSEPDVPSVAPFIVETVGEAPGPLQVASGMPVEVQRAVGDVTDADIVIAPSVILDERGWQRGRHDALVDWIGDMHDRGAVVCSACSGIFLLAETGLFDGRDATVHWSYASCFARTYPEVRVHPERVLVISGSREQLVSSGAAMSWHDLVLYLISRYVGPTAARSVSRFFALQWHHDGLLPFIMFEGCMDHGDGCIVEAQAWLARHYAVANPVEEMVRRSRMATRTFKRRFTAATGHPPIRYVQRLRVEEAKRQLELTDAPVDEISFRVGYEDPAFFRRLFRRTTSLSPGAYRRRFRVPSYVRATPTESLRSSGS